MEKRTCISYTEPIIYFTSREAAVVAHFTSREAAAQNLDTVIYMETPNNTQHPPIRTNALPKFFPININLHTNLPDETDETGLATRIFPLTGDMFGQSSNKPFFSSEIDYSYGVNFFKSITREEQIKVFFDRNMFRNFIRECNTKKMNEINSNSEAFIQSALDEYEKEKKNSLEENGIAERNIFFMLNIFIKISFPKKTKVKETYNRSTSVKNILSTFEYTIDTIKKFYNPLVLYTYLTYEGKDYTVVKARWQNDFYSHPEFFKLYNTYRIYTEWFNAEKKEEIIDRFKASPFYFTGTQLYSEDIVEYIVMAFALDFMKKEDADDYLKTIMTFDGRTIPYNEYKEKKKEIDYVFKTGSYNTVESRENYLKKNKIIAIKDFELVSSRARYSENIKRSQAADYENFKKLIAKVYDFIKDQPDWSNFNELKKETLSKVKENIYNKKLRCLLSDITYLSKTGIEAPPAEETTRNAVAVAAAPSECDKLIGHNVRKQIERRNFYVGVQKKGGANGEFEISLYVDLFGGKIDKTNKSRYKCAFLGEKLGNEFEALWNSRYYVKSRFYFDSKDFDREPNTTDSDNIEKSSKKEKDDISKKSEDETDKKNDRKKRDDDSDSDDELEGGNKRRRKRHRKRHHKTLRKKNTKTDFKKRARRRKTCKKTKFHGAAPREGVVK